jgi:hypothetical protein
MGDWYGHARSNYVRVTDVEALEASLKPFDVAIIKGSDKNEGKVYLISNDDKGGWPSSYYSEEKGDYVEFDPATHICPFMDTGEVLVMMEAGAEKTCYITGIAQAYNSKGEYTQVSLGDIYEKAAEKFKVERTAITNCEY